MSGSSEEKNLPASAKKLAERRRKGHIAKAPDLQVAVVSVTLIGWLLVESSTISSHLQALIHTAAQALTLDFPSGIRLMADATRRILILDALTPLLIAVVASVLVKLIVNRGFIFAIDPILPKLEKINPIAGFKNLFKAQNFVDLGISLIKTTLFGGTLMLIIYSAMGGLVRVPEIEPAGLTSVLRALLLPMFGAACFFYAAAGLADLLIQRLMFLREMRMTQTEAKNERKETLGNPLIKQQQRRMQMEARRNPTKLGPTRATILICDDNLVVGLRYKPGDTPVPQIVCKGRGEQAQGFRNIARERHVPMCWNRELARDLFAAFKPGMTITTDFFQPVAYALQNTPS
ncbi:EscU/YscU/HrcU family type III secretion system export apparatus switch protein [Kozakia baliensis]|uniref:EscU/YscU/HrcU family type III secretion system export apparatus switch protein n=1 Tax=Kozakia baliensis TaxID=153496 RepID=UPI00068BA2F3|nr:EscU/YscU/HrcU family type III secretion system export apparatus switch protein [Kozakia baliensis]